MENLLTIANIVIFSSVLSLLSLFILHFVSPEFHPSWRMVSEYTLGKNKWLLTVFFISWSVSTIFAAYLYFNIVSTKWASLGAMLIFISGVGALMGGLFDMKHKLHGLSFVLGVPTFPIGALIIAYHLGNQNQWLEYKSDLLISAHSLWISLVLMGLSMGLFISGLKKSGIPFGPDQQPLEEIPKGVVAINGYANRLLILAYEVFNITASLIFLNL